MATFLVLTRPVFFMEIKSSFAQCTTIHHGGAHSKREKTFSHLCCLTGLIQVEVFYTAGGEVMTWCWKEAAAAGSRCDVAHRALIIAVGQGLAAERRHQVGDIAARDGERRRQKPRSMDTTRWGFATEI
jgi:hypothetical protein